MVSDSTFSYVHMDSQVSILFVEAWENQKLRWDDVEFPNGEVVEQHDNLLQQFLSQNEETDTDLTVMNSSNPMFNASYANRVKQKSRKLNWKDMDLNAFSSKNNRKNQIHDLTILNKPNLGKYSSNNDIDAFSGLAESAELGLSDNGVNEDTMANERTVRQFSMNSDEELDFDNDNAASNRMLSNPDVSRSFSYQYATPTLNNKASIHNFQGSSHRTMSQQKRHVSDNSTRNVSYNTPGHRNIR